MLGWTGRIVLVLAILIALGYFMHEVWLRVRIIRRGKHDVKRWDRPAERLGYMIGRVGAQICAIKDRPFTGVMHAFVFWGFIFFTVATLNHVGGAFKSGFSLFGKNTFNDLWFLGVDVVAALTLIAVIALAVRRYIFKPAGITQPQPISRSPHSAIVLALIFGLMLTYLLNQGAEMILKGASFAAYMPVSKATAGLVAGMAPATLHAWNLFFWWSHILMVLGFLMFIPGSKHLHLLSGPVNIFFRSREPIGTLQPIDFEKTEQFGVSTLPHYQWKNISDFFACIDCGRCQDVCPAYATGKPLSPKVVMMSQRKHALHEARALVSGGEPSESIMNTWLTPDEIWACTTCGACMEACPVMNEHIPTLIDLRRNKAMMESDFPQELNAAFRGLETNANPWNMGHDSRTAWTDGLNVPIMSQAGEVEYLWYVGCAGSFDDRAKAVSRAVAQILNQAGVSYAILGLEEKCCGDPARRAGNEYLFSMMAMENVQVLQQYKFRKILTTCPHGYHMIKNEYKQFGGQFEVVHHTELIAELIKSGKLKVNQNGLDAVTFHDSCYLGRYNEIYQAPRDILQQLSGRAPVEMGRHHNKSFCCGAGGGRMFMEESLGTRINHSRTEEAAATGAKMVGTACPFCLSMLDDGIKETGITEKLQVRDIAQLVVEHLQS